MRVPCKYCGSTEGAYRSFYKATEYRDRYYWVCNCGKNCGDGPTQNDADTEWNAFMSVKEKGGEDDPDGIYTIP